MTQLGLGFGQLIQQGIGSGWDNYRADQQMQLARASEAARAEQQAVNLELMRQELAQRRRAAAEHLAQQEADQQVTAAIFGAQEGGTNPDGTPGNVDWMTGINPDLAARASPRVQEFLTKHKENRLALGQRRAELTSLYDLASKQGALPYVTDHQWGEFIDNGVPGLDFSKAPESVRARAINREENTKRAQIDMMTIPDTDGTVGPPNVDVQGASWLETQPAATVDMLFRQRWLPAEQLRQKQKQAEAERVSIAQAHEVYNNPKASPSERAAAYALLAQKNMPIPRDPGTSADATQRRWAAAKAIDQAKNGVEEAMREYKAFNQDEKDADGRLMPPTPDEVELAASKDSGWFTSDSTWNRAKAKVAAWQKYEQAKKALDAAYRASQAAPAMPAAPVSPAPAPSSPASPSLPSSAPYNDPHSEGEAYSDEGAAAIEQPGNLADSMIEDYISANPSNDQTYDVGAMIGKMLDANIPPDEIKRALKAKGFQ